MKQARRNFLRTSLGSLLMLAGVNRLAAAVLPPAESKFGMGKYKRHWMKSNIDFAPMFEQPFKHITFPVETVLDIDFANGTETYVTFNLTREQFAAIANMNGHQLMTGWQEEAQSNFENNMFPVLTLAGAKFRLSSAAFNPLPKEERHE